MEAVKAKVIGWVKVDYTVLPYINKDSNGYEVLKTDGTTDWRSLTSCREVQEPKWSAINPDHYKIGGIETIDYLKAKLTPEQFKGYCLGNIIKYTSRHHYKNGEEDLKKSQWYMNKLLETLEG